MEMLSPLLAIYILFYMNIAEQSCETVWPTLSIGWTTKKGNMPVSGNDTYAYIKLLKK